MIIYLSNLVNCKSLTVTVNSKNTALQMRFMMPQYKIGNSSLKMINFLVFSPQAVYNVNLIHSRFIWCLMGSYKSFKTLQMP